MDKSVERILINTLKIALRPFKKPIRKVLINQNRNEYAKTKALKRELELKILEQYNEYNNQLAKHAGYTNDQLHACSEYMSNPNAENEKKVFDVFLGAEIPKNGASITRYKIKDSINEYEKLIFAMYDLNCSKRKFFNIEPNIEYLEFRSRNKNKEVESVLTEMFGWKFEHIKTLNSIKSM